MSRAPLRGAAGTLSAAMLLFAIAVFRLLAPSATLAKAEQPTRPIAEDVRFVRPLSASIGEVQEALDANPFSGERQRPVARFGEHAMNPLPVVERRSEIRNVRLLGTTVSGLQSFALVEHAGQPPRVIKLNEVFMGFTVSRIERGKLVLSSRDSTVVFDLNRGK